MKKKRIIVPIILIVFLILSYFASGTTGSKKKDHPEDEKVVVKRTIAEKDRKIEKKIDSSAKPRKQTEEASKVQDKEKKHGEQQEQEEQEKQENHEKETKKLQKNHEKAQEGTTTEQQAPSMEKKEEPTQEKNQEEGSTVDAVATASVEEEKDTYQTSKIPEGKPKPVEWQDTEINKKQVGTITLQIECKTILDNLEKLDKHKVEIVPKGGIIYEEQEVAFYEGESVFDVLLRETRKHKIHMEFVMTPMYNSNYIEGIGNLYEFDCGELSGWMYKVNGWFPNYGCSRYKLSPGDQVVWAYTCDLGRDLGQDMGGE